MSGWGFRQKMKAVFNISHKDGEITPTANQGDGQADMGMPASGSDTAGNSLRDMEPARIAPPTGTVGSDSDFRPDSAGATQAPRPLSWPQPTVQLPKYVDDEDDETPKAANTSAQRQHSPEQLPLPDALTVTPGCALKSFGSDTDMPVPQVEAQFPASALGSTDSHLPTGSFGSTTTDYDGMYPPGMHKDMDFTDAQSMAMAQAHFMGMPPMYCVGPQMWAPYGHVPPQMYGGYPGAGPGMEGGDPLQETAEDLEQKASELMAVARRMKQTARQARYSGSVSSAGGGSQRGSVSSVHEATALGSKGHRQAALAHTQNLPVEAVEDDKRTTVMLRNLPNDYTRNMLLELLDNEGFASRYNFVYLPMDFKRMAGLGYAFVNMETPEDAQAAWKHFVGFQQWTLQSMKICEVAWGEPLQGLDQHIERYRNSPVMHEEVPEEFKPVLFNKGQRITFPDPTKRIRPPRMKYRTPAEGRASTASSTADAAVMAAVAAGSTGSAPGGSEGGGASAKFVD